MNSKVIVAKLEETPAEQKGPRLLMNKTFTVEQKFLIFVQLRFVQTTKIFFFPCPCTVIIVQNSGENINRNESSWRCVKAVSDNFLSEDKERG
jgi:hypothetical protein